MDWANERYVRLYTRDTLNWKRIGWEGRCVFCLTLRKVDRSGILEVDESDPAGGLATMIDMPEEIVRVGLERVVAVGTFELNGGQLLIPEFLEAQETPQSDRMRQRESRERRRANGLVRDQSGKKDRWIKDQVTEGHRRSLLPSLPSLASKKKPPISPPSGGGVCSGFDDFWERYPVKKSKQAALKAWAKLKPTSDLQARILADVAARCEKDSDWLRGAIPFPATYLNGERWTDEIRHAPGPGNGISRGVERGFMP